MEAYGDGGVVDWSAVEDFGWPDGGEEAKLKGAGVVSKDDDGAAVNGGVENGMNVSDGAEDDWD